MTAAVRVNPVLGRELRERMRRNRSAVVILLFLAVLSAVAVLAYTGYRDGGSSGEPPVTRLEEIGRGTFGVVLLTMVLLVLFLVPGSTAGSIAGERERQTLVSLQMTTMRPFSVLWGKVTSSLAFTTLLLVAALPVLSVTYLIGGVKVSEILVGLASVLVLALLMACVGVACSAFTKRASTGILLCYGLIVLLTVGSTVAFGIAALRDQTSGPRDISPLYLVPNPVVDVAFAVGQPGSAATSPFDWIRSSLDPSIDEILVEAATDQFGFGAFGAFGVDADALLDDAPMMFGIEREIIEDLRTGELTRAELRRFEEATGLDIPRATERELFDRSTSIPMWAQGLAFQVALAALLLWRASRRIRVPAASDR